MEGYQESQLSSPSWLAHDVGDEDCPGEGNRKPEAGDDAEGEGSYVDALFGHGGEAASPQLALTKQKVHADQDYWDKLIESETVTCSIL